VPFFFKQWGGVRKDLAGRELNGRTYSEMPGAMQSARAGPELPGVRETGDDSGVAGVSLRLRSGE